MTAYREQLIRTGNSPEFPAALCAERAPWLPTDRGAAIVDVGCAWGTLLLGLKNGGYKNLFGVDNDVQLVEEARRRCGDGVTVQHLDAMTFFETSDRFYERVLLFHVLEHFSAEDGTRLLTAIRKRLVENGLVVIEVPNVTSITGMHMQCSDLTHRTAFTEFSLRQMLANAGYPAANTLYRRPPLRLWRTGKSGSGLGWRVNYLLHRLLYSVTNCGPRPSCFSPSITVTAGPGS